MVHFGKRVEIYRRFGRSDEMEKYILLGASFIGNIFSPFFFSFYFFSLNAKGGEYISRKQNEMGHFNPSTGEFACEKEGFSAG